MHISPSYTGIGECMCSTGVHIQYYKYQHVGESLKSRNLSFSDQKSTVVEYHIKYKVNRILILIAKNQTGPVAWTWLEINTPPPHIFPVMRVIAACTAEGKRCTRYDCCFEGAFFSSSFFVLWTKQGEWHQTLRPNSWTKSRQKSWEFPPGYSQLPLQLFLKIFISSNSCNLLQFLWSSQCSL
jgi:hypothetical protein